MVRFTKPTRENNFIQGYVAIKHNGVWGTICDDHFDQNNNGAKVLCKMMGFTGGEYNKSYRQTGVTRASAIWLDNVKCLGTERNIDTCPRNAWGKHNCGHSEDVAIRCRTGKQYHFVNIVKRLILYLAHRSAPNDSLSKRLNHKFKCYIRLSF